MLWLFVFAIKHLFMDYAPLLPNLVVSIPSQMVAVHLQKEQGIANNVLNAPSTQLRIIREDVQVQADLILDFHPAAWPQVSQFRRHIGFHPSTIVLSTRLAKLCCIAECRDGGRKAVLISSHC